MAMGAPVTTVGSPDGAAPTIQEDRHPRRHPMDHGESGDPAPTLRAREVPSGNSQRQPTHHPRPAFGRSPALVGHSCSVMHRRAFLHTLAGASSLALAARAQPIARPIATVALAPLGPFPAAFLDEIDAGLRAELGVDVVRLDPAPLPPAAWYPPRRRYRAERLIDALRPRVRPPATRVLGVTQADISTTAHGVHDWGVLGLGDLGGLGCVISTFRCRMNSPSEAQTHFRMVTTCVHEIGHTLGLEHCPDTTCLMTDARGLVRTVDRTTGHLCVRCRQRLGLAARA